MKKLFTTLLLLLGAVLVINAQTKILKVGDQQIDLTKDGTYTGIGDENGTATYTVSEKRLYLKNIHLTDKMISGQDLSDATYYISLQSDLYVMQFTRFCMRFDRSNITFEGNGNNLILNGINNSSYGYSTFDAEDSNVTFQNVFLYVSAGGSDAFYGRNSITFNCVYALIFSSSRSAFKGFKSMSFSDCKLETGLKFISGTGVTDYSGNMSSSVQLRPYLRVGEDLVRTEATSATGTNWSWDKSTKTLNIKDATFIIKDATIMERFLALDNNHILENYGVDDLTVKFMGTNQLTSTGEANYSSVIYSEKKMNITGYGANLSSLILTGYRGINIENASLTFDNINVSIDAKEKGVNGYNGVDLAINNSSLTVLGQSEGSIVGIKSCTMTDCDVDAEQNPNVCFRSSLKGFGTPSDIYKKTIFIRTFGSADKYLMYVLGHQVNKLNKSNIAVDGLTEGTISFDNSTKVLTLTNVDLESPEGNTQPGIDCRISGIQIRLVGSNTVTTDGTAFDVYFNGDFSGSGSLTAVSKSANGLEFTGANMTISVNNTVRFKGKVYGCVANYVSGKEFTLKKADTKSDYYFSGEEQALRVYYDLVLTDMDFYYSSNYGTPGCYFDKSQHCVVQNGGTPVSGNNEVNFFNINSGYPRYDLYVGGTQVTGCNKYGIGSMYITAGGPTAVTYNGTTKTLTLTDATITNKGEDLNALKNSGVDGLTINVVGDNTLQTERSGWNGDNTSVNISSNTTITGNGTLNVKGIGPLYVSNGKKLTIKDAKKIVVERNIRSNTSSSTAELVVDNSNVESTSVGLFKSVTWLNGSLAEPVNGKFDPESTYIVDANGNKASRVVFIDQAATAIDAVEVDNNADIRSIYDANGRQMDSARKGLNIIRMSDGTVRKVMVK